MSERPLQCQCCGGLVCLFRELCAALLTRVEERRYNRKSREQSERIIAMTKESVIKNLQGAECFYVPFSISTKMPYVICDEEDFDDQILACEEEEDLKAYVKARAEEKILLQVTRVEKSMYTRFYGNLYGIGVNAIVYKKGQEERKVELAEVAVQADFSKVPREKKPLLNPSLQLSGIYFMQAWRRAVPDQEKGDVRSLEEELVVNIIRSKFLLAVNVEQEGDQRKLNIPYVKNKNGDIFQPCFSDIMEFQKFAAGRKLGMIQVNFKKMLSLLVEQSKGYVLNPAGFNLTLAREQLEKMAKVK